MFAYIFGHGPFNLLNALQDSVQLHHPDFAVCDHGNHQVCSGELARSL